MLNCDHPSPSLRVMEKLSVYGEYHMNTFYFVTVVRWSFICGKCQQVIDVSSL